MAININQSVSKLATLLNKNDVNLPSPDLDPTSGTNIVSKIFTLTFGVFGGIALIIIIMAGIKFITSQGDPQATAKARNTIIYAAIGLAVSVAAFTIVTFVTGKI